jgi:TonB-dependent SusC/RagA subfamily outer membrane receptor
MKRLSLLLFSIVLSFTILNGQEENKDPLIVVNGKISNVQLTSIDPDNIESVSVTKPPSFKEEYGILSENGVISIVTRDYVRFDDQEESKNPIVLVNGKVYGYSLDSINVVEIESLNVLKGISATRLYGKAGENGVILITLKEKTKNRQ